MANGVLRQEALNPVEPPDWASTSTIRCVLDFAIFDTTGLSFFYKDIVTVPDDDDDEFEKMNIDVKKDVTIIVDLEPTKKWRWSTKLQAITTKKRYEDFYGKLLYKRGAIYRPRPDDETWETYSIQFLAGLNGNLFDAVHGFSLNIDLQQPDGKWLPITLDPDIKNPPPDPDLTEEGDPADGLNPKVLSAE
jgi:hypothetical protein